MSINIGLVLALVLRLGLRVASQQIASQLVHKLAKGQKHKPNFPLILLNIPAILNELLSVLQAPWCLAPDWPEDVKHIFHCCLRSLKEIPCQNNWVLWRGRNSCQVSNLKISLLGASLVVQWLRICLPMQGTCVWALVWEDPTCCGATGPMSHNYWACTSGACAPQQQKLR